MVGVAVLYVAAGGPLEIGVELDSIGRVEVAIAPSAPSYRPRGGAYIAVPTFRHARRLPRIKCRAAVSGFAELLLARTSVTWRAAGQQLDS